MSKRTKKANTPAMTRKQITGIIINMKNQFNGSIETIKQQIFEDTSMDCTITDQRKTIKNHKINTARIREISYTTSGSNFLPELSVSNY